MNSKPLDYDSLRNVFLRMDPILRFRLSTRLPSIRCCERNVPIYMRFLSINPSALLVDKFIFTLGCVQKDVHILTERQGRIVNILKKRRVGYDLNKYGLYDQAVSNILTPGGVIYPTKFDSPERRNRNLLEGMTEELDEMLGEMDGLIVFPETHLVFTMLSDNVPIHTEHLDYSKTLAQAMKYLNSKLLGDRSIHTAKFWNIESGVLRLPKHLNFCISRMWTLAHDVAKIHASLQKVLDPRSPPLKWLRIKGGDSFNLAENYNHPIPSFWVHWECRVPNNDISEAVRTWLVKGREIGSDVSFGISKVEDARTLMEEFKRQKGALVEEICTIGCPTFPEVITFKLDRRPAEFSIHCDEIDRKDYSRWHFNMVVTPIGHKSLWNVDFKKDVFK